MMNSLPKCREVTGVDGTKSYDNKIRPVVLQIVTIVDKN